MKNKMNAITLSVIMFVLGVVATLSIMRAIVMPNLAKDISKMAYESAENGYFCGYTDGINKNDEMYNKFFNEEDVKEINEWKYKYVK